MRITMPSPRGTNHEGMYLPSSFPMSSPAGACDAAMEDRSAMLARLAKMTPRQLERVIAMLDEETAEDDNLLESEMLGPSDPRAFPSRKAPNMDNPPNFKGAPKTGGKIGAMDSAYFGRLGASNRMTRAERSFAEMYPAAAKIKCR